MRLPGALLVGVLLATPTAAQSPDWKSVDTEALKTLQSYIRSRDLFAPGKLVFGVSVAEKKILWPKLTAEGVAGHGSRPHDSNPNDRLVRALARLLGEPMPASSFSVLETLKSRVDPLAPSKFNNAIQHSTISLTSLRSGVGEPPKINVIPIRILYDALVQTASTAARR